MKNLMSKNKLDKCNRELVDYLASNDVIVYIRIDMVSNIIRFSLDKFNNKGLMDEKDINIESSCINRSYLSQLLSGQVNIKLYNILKRE